MLPIVLKRGLATLPKEVQAYAPLIEECIQKADIGRRWMGDRCVQMAYLTVDERDVTPGDSHRRGGLHTESPGAALLLGGRTDIRPDSVYHRWGIGVRNHKGVLDGIFMASTVADSTAVYSARLRRPGVDEGADALAIGELGDCEHYRGVVQHSRRTLKANEMVWMTDLTLHESVPLTAGSHRQYFRLVVGDIGAWYEAHSTPNPLCPLPKGVVIVRGSKFDVSAKSADADDGTDADIGASAAAMAPAPLAAE